ncbi:MAG TPA: C4-dicarboxylate transporter DcuC [Gemmatimonadales bacterium]
MILALAVLVIIAAIALMVRRVDVRLVLLGSGLALMTLAGNPLGLADTFTRGMVTGMVAPICAAMGFAAVMKATGCDRHLVQLLLAPIRRVPWLVLPGGILAAYLVNMAVPSQASTAAALGPILVPLLIASGFPATVAGAALILGASFGGDLLNPGAQDIQAVAGVTQISAAALSTRVIPAGIAGSLTAALAFMVIHRRAAGTPDTAHPLVTVAALEENFRIDLLRALIPIVPIAMLLAGYLGMPGMGWLIRTPAGPEWAGLSNALPVVRAMLIGAGLAALVAWREVSAVTRSLFDGMGTAYGGIISLTITAQCFGAGIGAVGLAEVLLEQARASDTLGLLAGGFPWALATLSGSGSGPILAFAQTFLVGLDGSDASVRLGALACLGGAFGRTMSPVSAVVVYSAGLVDVAPMQLIKRLLMPLLLGAAVAMGVAVR